MLRHSFTAMGTTVELGVSAHEGLSHENWLDLVQTTTRTIQTYESTFSRFHSTSELTYINEHPGRWVDISPDMASVLSLAREACELSSGLFNPCVGHILENIGYRESFCGERTDRTDTICADESPTLLRLHNATFPYALSPASDRVYLIPGYKIDLGGIAKGWIVEQVAARWRHSGLSNFVISAGGDMVCAGVNDGLPWQVDIEDPHVPNAIVTSLNVSSSAAATSATLRRHWNIGNQRMHHIIDPTSLAPARSDIVSCTVVAPTLVAAEVYAKTALILGSERGIAWLNQQIQRGWVLVDDGGEVMDSWNS